MARLETVIRDHLLTIPAITAITEDRILDFDYRASGWNTAPVQVLDEDDLILPTLVVDDAGDSHPIFQMAGAEEHRIQVWAFNVRSSQGVDQVDTMMRLVKSTLDRWQDPESRAMLNYVDRQGKLSVEDGVVDRLFFRVAHVRKVEV